MVNPDTGERAFMRVLVQRGVFDVRDGFVFLFVVVSFILVATEGEGLLL